jgi:hypothetical protein
VETKIKELENIYSKKNVREFYYFFLLTEFGIELKIEKSCFFNEFDLKPRNFYNPSHDLAFRLLL